MKTLLFLSLLLFVSCGHKEGVKFTEEEQSWLKSKGLYERSINAPDSSKLKIKEIVNVELSLIHDLKDLADEMNAKFKDSLGIEVTFSSPVTTTNPNNQ